MQNALITRQLARIRERRNGVVAHLDFLTALNTYPEPLPVVDMGQFDEFLRLLAELINVIVGCDHAAHRDFNPIITGPFTASCSP